MRMSKAHPPCMYAEVDRFGVVHALVGPRTTPPRAAHVGKWWLPYGTDMPAHPTMSNVRFQWAKGTWECNIITTAHDRAIVLRRE